LFHSPAQSAQTLIFYQTTISDALSGSSIDQHTAGTPEDLFCAEKRGNWKMVQWSPRPPVTITVEPEELAQRYLDGASLDDLSVLCGCTATRIRRILVAQGVEIRPRGHDHGNGRSTKFVRR
jgi:hypothetical protein